MTSEDFDQLFEDIKELVELNNANNLSLANMGGIQALLELIVAHKEDSVRKSACQLFSSVTANNDKVQNFATKSGAVNLAGQLDREKTPVMREAVLGALSAFVRSENFEGKRQYILKV